MYFAFQICKLKTCKLKTIPVCRWKRKQMNKAIVFRATTKLNEMGRE